MISTLFKGLSYLSLVYLLAACIEDDSASDGNSESRNSNNLTIQDSVISLRNIENSQCPNGGVDVEMGIDANGNGRLDSSEVDHSRTVTVCHGLDGDGQEGFVSLIRINDATLAQCPNGGKVVSIGLDINKNSFLEVSEITQTESICNQNAPAYTALINTGNEPAGPNCINGGIKIETGLDSNQNSMLDVAEVQNTEYICHGEDGAGSSNPDLSNLLIETIDEPWGENCFHGGQKHQIGKDLNEDGILEGAEIISASYSCNPNEAPEIYFQAVYPDYPQDNSTNDAIAGQFYSLTVKAHDNYDEDSFLSVVNKPVWMTVSEIQPDHFELSGTVPNVVDATYQIEISATDTDAESSATYKLVAREGILVSTIAPNSIVEGDSGSQVVNFELRLSQAASNAIQVKYSLNSFIGLGWLENEIRESGVAVFEPGETSKSISLEIQSDTQVEIAEAVELSITHVENPGSEFIKTSKSAFLDVINDDGNELVFNSGQLNNLEIAYFGLHLPYHFNYSSQVSIELTEGAPDWLSLVRDYHQYYLPHPPYGDISFEKYILSGSPDSELIGQSGSFSLQLTSERGQSTHDLTYRIIEGDTDNDGVLNSADLFPENPRAHSDSDGDGIGDEWEIARFENLVTANATSDFDGNGVTDLSAFQNNTSVHDLTFSFEDGQLPEGWVNTGNVDWVVSDESSYHGGYALKPATPLEPGQVARLEMTINNNEGRLYVHGRAAEGEEYLNPYDLKFNYVDESHSQIYLHDTGWNSTSTRVNAGQNRFVLEYKNRSNTGVARQVYVDYFHGLSGIIPADRDGDGVLNIDDAFPDNAIASTDTDGDGIGDEWEERYFSGLDRVNAISDDDGDGLSDLQEFLSGSNPYNRDTDSDGVYDSQDLWPTNNEYATDSDADGLADEWELTHFASLQDTDGSQDSDGDLVLDADEFSQGTIPTPDADGDGYSDLQDAFVNDPAYALDEDSDGLPDEWESNYGSLYYLYAEGDRDNDGYTDKQEFVNGTNPVVANLNTIQDVFAVSAGQSITFNPLTNDTSGQSVINLTNIQLPQVGEGSLQNNGDGTYTYTAPANYIGWIQLDYTADDFLDTQTGQIMIRVSEQQFGQVVKIKGTENESHAMALFDDGTLYSWGNNSNGQLGLGDSEVRYSPVLVSGIEDVQDFDLGGSFSLALKEDGTVWWWGHGTNTPQQLINVSNIQAIATENSTMHVLKADGTVASSSSGNGVTATFSTISGMTDIQEISAGYNHLLALDNNGVVWAEGYNSYGQLGDGTTSSSNNVAVQVSKISSIQSIEAGYNRSFAINDQGQLYAWGYNYYGHLGDGTTTSRDAPVLVSTLSNVAEVSAGEYHTLVRTVGGQVYGMGRGTDGKLGENASDWSNRTPLLVTSEHVEAISAGHNQSYLVTTSGDTLSVGNNYNGVLGDGTTTTRNNFVNIDWLHVGYEGLLSELTGEGFEWGVLPSFWRNTGNSWEISTEANSGDYSLKVKDSVSDSSSSSVGLQITTGAGDISFVVKTSTEETYDYLAFYVDGVEQARYSGETDWATTQNFTVTAGTHVVEWTYIKDSGTSAAEDTVWIDDIVLPIDTDGDGVLDVDDLNPNNPIIQ